MNNDSQITQRMIAYKQAVCDLMELYADQMTLEQIELFSKLNYGAWPLHSNWYDSVQEMIVNKAENIKRSKRHSHRFDFSDLYVKGSFNGDIDYEPNFYHSLKLVEKYNFTKEQVEQMTLKDKVRLNTGYELD